MQLVEEVNDGLPGAHGPELKLTPAGQLGVLLLPNPTLISLLLPLSLRLVIVLALEFRGAVDVLVGAHIVPLPRHDEITLQVDQHDQNEQVP